MKKITKNTKLFNNGLPSVFGYATSGKIDYNISEAKIKKFSLKEWDFYQITSEEFCMQMTIGHVSYMTSVNCVIFDFLTGNKISVGKMIPFRKIKLDENADKPSTVTYSDKNFEMSFKVGKGYRQLRMKGQFKKYGKVNVDVTMLNQSKESILVVTPFEKENEFYLNQKICCMPTSGIASFGQSDFNFTTKKNYALLDWGRGVLPYRHEWLWSNGSGSIDGKLFGFNIGVFGREDFANENAVFYDGKTYKFDKINFTFDKNDYMSPWTFKSDNGEFDLVMTPTYDNFTATKLLFVNNSCHQVFGKFNGKIKLSDDLTLEVKDLFAFCENAKNQW